MSQSTRTTICANLPLALALLAGCGDASPDCPSEAFEFGGGRALIESPFCVSPGVR